MAEQRPPNPLVEVRFLVGPQQKIRLGVFFVACPSKTLARLATRNRMAERYFESFQNREPVTRQIFATAKI